MLSAIDIVSNIYKELELRHGYLNDSLQSLSAVPASPEDTASALT